MCALSNSENKEMTFSGVLTVGWHVETLITWTNVYTYKQTPASYWEQWQYYTVCI